MNRALIIYHKNCMDGLASAYITKEALSYSNDKYFFFTDIETLPLQYGEEEYLLNEMKLNKSDTIYFVDFSLKRDKMIELSKKVNIINVLDHHKTAKTELENIEDEVENITVIFDMEKCGATICYDYFMQLLPKEFPNRELFEYIEDRDLGKWELELSKEISAGLRWLVNTNDIEQFADIAQRYKDEKNKLEYIGKIVTLQQQREVESKIKKTKDITLEGINFKCLNATENISEIGNAICTTYNTPALVYFITEKDEVVCSLRSIDTLEDVSVVANALGGGGHRNACGFTLRFNDFMILMSDARFLDKAETKKTVDDEYESFWKHIVEVDGELDKEQIEKELYDFSQIIGNVSKVYCHITNSRISNPLTLPNVVMQVADECKELELEDNIKEELSYRSINLSLFDENNEEQIIKIEPSSTVDEEVSVIYDITEIIAERDIKALQNNIHSIDIPDTLDLLEETIRDYYTSQGYKLDGSWWFRVDIWTIYKNKNIKVMFQDYKTKEAARVIYFDGDISSTKEMFDKAFEFFKVEDK